MRKVVGGGVAVMALGCFATLSAPPSKPVVEFPSQARLAAVEGKSTTLPPMQTGDVPAEGWSVAPPPAPAPAPPAPAPAAPAPPPAGPAPAPAVEPIGDVWTPQGPWEETFASAYAASGRKAGLTRAMACTARELGRFYLQKQAPAPEPLQRFLTAACGVVAPSIGYESLKGTLPAGAPDEKLVPRWKDQVGPGMAARIPVGAKHAGFWFGRHGGNAVGLVVYESTPVELKPFSPVPDFNGDVAVEGRLEGDADYFAGYANQGRFGVRKCLVDPSVPRPRFRISCRMAADDDTAWIQIVYAAPRSVLAQPIVQMLARRDAGKPLVYSETSRTPSRPVTDAASFGPAVLAGLNATRVEAGLQPVRLAEAQSATAARVARQYFAAALAGASGGGAGTALDDMNTVALGLLAGWQVVGTIRDGTFFSGLVPRTRDAGRWVDYALALPLGRHALMAADIDEVALGPALFDNPNALGAVACGYRFHRSNDHTADVNSLFERVALARQRSNLPPPVRLKGMDAVLRRELTRVQEGARTPFTALRASLDEATGRTGADTRGIVVETTSLDALEIPPQVLARRDLQLEIGVTHYKPPGAAWAQFVIVVVYVSPGGVEI